MATVTEKPTHFDDDSLFEIVDGQRVELPPMSAFAAIIASRLLGELHLFLRTNAFGEAVMETLFDLGRGGRDRRPDVAFVSVKRWPRNRRQPVEDNAWKVVPNLAVEVVSPHDYLEDLMRKSRSTSWRESSKYG